MVEEASAASASLEDQAGHLVDAVSSFKLGEAAPAYTTIRAMPQQRESAAPQRREPARMAVAGDAALPKLSAKAHDEGRRAGKDEGWKEF
jgi:methyl-accepting chemotaxis protein